MQDFYLLLVKLSETRDGTAILIPQLLTTEPVRQLTKRSQLDCSVHKISLAIAKKHFKFSWKIIDAFWLKSLIFCSSPL